MKRRFSGSEETPNIVSDGFIEAMWEMLIALGTAAAICIGVVSLSAHLNAVQKVRGIAEYSTQAPDATNPRLPGVARMSTKLFHEEQWAAPGSWEPAPLDRVPRLAPDVGEAEEGERGTSRLRMVSPIWSGARLMGIGYAIYAIEECSHEDETDRYLAAVQHNRSAAELALHPHARRDVIIRENERGH
jgi:hypothetical protein